MQHSVYFRLAFDRQVTWRLQLHGLGACKRLQTIENAFKILLENAQCPVFRYVFFNLMMIMITITMFYLTGKPTCHDPLGADVLHTCLL